MMTREEMDWGTYGLVKCDDHGLVFDKGADDVTLDLCVAANCRVTVFADIIANHAQARDLELEGERVRWLRGLSTQAVQ